MDDFKVLTNTVNDLALSYVGESVYSVKSVELALAYVIRHSSDEQAKLAFDILRDESKFWSLYRIFHNNLATAYSEG